MVISISLINSHWYINSLIYSIFFCLLVCVMLCLRKSMAQKRVAKFSNTIDRVNSNCPMDIYIYIHTYLSTDKISYNGY